VKSLFDEERTVLCCPYDGQILTDSKWEFCGRKLRMCPDRHVWEITKAMFYGNGFTFRLVDMTKCRCGQSWPKSDMKAPPDPNKKTQPICPDCYAVVREAWRPDPELSRARLTINPIKEPDGLIFYFQSACDIKPYPNPYGHGGWYGGGAVKTEAELEKVISDFRRSVEMWEKLGVKVEVIRNPEMTRTESANQRAIDQVEKDPEARPQLRLMG